MYASVLFLMPNAYAQFMPSLKREFPQLLRRDKKLYTRSAYLNGEYKEGISRIVAKLRARFESDSCREEAPLTRKYEQLALGL